MSLNLNTAPMGSGKKDNGIPRKGTQIATLVGVVVLGKQARQFQGEDKAPAVLINLTYELPTDLIKTDEGNLPRWIGQNRLAFSRNEKATLAKAVKALDPLDECKGDLAKLIGRACLLAIEHHKKPDMTDFAKVANISPMMEGIPVPALISEPMVFDFYDPNIEVFNKLPKWTQEIITNALDFKGSKLEAALSGTATVAAAPIVVDPVTTSDDDRPY